jgi:hypothetical protein
MFLRRFIRVVGLALLMLCIVAWMGSFWKAFYINCWHGDVILSIIKVNRGRIGISWLDWTWIDWSWNWGMGFGRPDEWGTSGFIGFSILKYGIIEHGIVVPIWFPTILFALLLWFLWRKSRARPRGFPVVTLEKRKGH